MIPTVAAAAYVVPKAQDMIPETDDRPPTRDKMGTMSPNRYVMIEREGGLVKIYTTNALGDKDRHNSILLEDGEARGVASIIRQHFPVDESPRSTWPLIVAWALGAISFALLYFLLAV